MKSLLERVASALDEEAERYREDDIQATEKTFVAGGYQPHGVGLQKLATELREYIHTQRRRARFGALELEVMRASLAIWEATEEGGDIPEGDKVRLGDACEFAQEKVAVLMARAEAVNT